MSLVKQKSRRASAVVGIHPGYYTGQMSEFNKDLGQFSNIVMAVAKECSEKGVDHVSFNIVQSNTAYNEEWGCPPFGEACYTLEAVANPTFVGDLVKWEENVVIVLSALKEKLEQYSVTIVFDDIEVVYLHGRKGK